LGSVCAVVIVSPTPIVMLNGLLKVFGVGDALSLNRTVNWNAPALLGVPLMTPPDVPSVRPFGKEPAVTDHVYGGNPPVPVRLWKYGEPTDPLASPVVVIVSGARFTCSVKVPVCIALLESVTVTMKLTGPGAVGCPVKTPPVLSVAHDGKLVGFHE